MSGINGIGGNTPVGRIASQPIQKQVPASPAKQVKLTDRVELTSVKQMLATLKASDGVRTDKVNAIRAELASGTYETSAKMDAAIERLIDDLGH